LAIGRNEALSRWQLAKGKSNRGRCPLPEHFDWTCAARLPLFERQRPRSFSGLATCLLVRSSPHQDWETQKKFRKTSACFGQLKAVWHLSWLHGMKM